MPIPVSREITDLKAEFEGGSSFSIDWYGILRRGAENVLDHINPETLKRTVPIYGGLTRNLRIYYCPDDVEVPSRLYSYDRTVRFDFMPPAQFYGKQNFLTQFRNKFTIEYVNGVRFIVVYHPTNNLVVTVDDMDDATDITGVTLEQNTYNVLPGSTASLQGTFTDASYAINRVLETPLDITRALRGVAIVPAYWDSALKVASVELILKTDDSNYYSMISTQDSVGDYFRDGQNMVRFWVNNATKTGTPDPTNITEYTLNVRMTTGESQTVILGKITVQESNLFFLEYYSNRLFVDGVTGAWKSTPASGDQINLNRDAAGILHYESARLVVQAATFNRVDGEESKRFDTELARKYEQYFSRNPSSEQPLMYSLMPNIPYSADIFGEGSVDDFGERVGETYQAELGNNVFFMDSEAVSGAINGINTVFTLSHAPNPALSLELILNGQYGNAGVLGPYTYTLQGNVITTNVPIDALFNGLPFTASYRYTI